MKKMLFLLLAALLPAVAVAYDAYIDGIYYYLDYAANTAGVAPYYDKGEQLNSKAYSGNVIIPSTVNYSGEVFIVTSISKAFYGCSGLTSVTIPNSVTSIGGGAFWNCSSLTSITIPNSVTSLGGHAFYGTRWYSNQSNGILYLDNWLIGYKGDKPEGKFVIAEGTRGIGGSVFYECSGLTSVTIPNSVTSIGDQAFYGCSGLTSVTIPNSVTSIGYYAFAGCSGLTSVTIPNSVTSIENGAFAGCSGLTSVTIPNSVTSIGQYAFDGTGWYNNQPDGILYLDNWLIGYKGEDPEGKLVISDGTRGIAAHAFYECSRLTSVSIPNSVASIGEAAFLNCSGLTSITIPNSVTSIGNYAFSGCSGLTSVTIPNSVTNIGGHAFYNCSGLTSVTIPNSVTSLNGTFSGCSGLTSVTIPNSVTSLNGTFSGCSGLTSVTIPNSVTSIGYGAFSECTGLTSVTIPNSVKCIGEDAFCACSGLASITIPNSVTCIGYGAFAGCSGLTSVTIPNSVTSIEHQAFDGCSRLASITIPNSVKDIGVDAFSGTRWYNNHSNGMLYLDNWLIGFKGDKPEGNLEIVEGTRGIGGGAFKDCSGLTSITIPNSLISIGHSAFYKCNGLTTVTIPNSVTSIGMDSFRECSNLTTVVIPNSVDSIVARAFMDCPQLMTVKSYIKEPFMFNGDSFSNETYNNGTLYVPAGTKEKYKQTGGWLFFQNIEEMEDEVTPSPNGECTMPTIIVMNGKFKFQCETPGATFTSSLTMEENFTGNEVAMDSDELTYTLTVYATAPGYDRSQPARYRFTVSKSDVNQDGSVDVADISAIITTMAAQAREQVDMEE